ncbi:hypothetical protein [uncultured Chitinophaga sp.]|jgi:hypothetical protein|uniref:hypothetical protein n=1 Tax=uncultured Chitinophaga sp. TaxID=339340 RepID=UPI00260BC8B3|nr:hypothetical protein [uncultured Chitinophaga sp.]
MADVKISVPLLLPVEERSPLISLVRGNITPEMYNSIEQLREFEGSKEEAPQFLSDIIRELVTRALTDPTARDVT